MSAPWLLDHAPFAPFMVARTAHPPGLSPLDLTEWTVRLPDFDAQMAYRARLMAERPEIVLGALHDGEDPALELLEMLLAHLGTPRELTLKERFDALTAIGHLVAEDFCLLVPDAVSGEYRLVAAILCFPSRWLLSEKLGHPLTAIHDPVPEYGDALARRVNRVFDALKTERPLVRVNWLVHPTPELHLPKRLSDKLMEAASSEGPFYLRTERQTLVRLPRTGAIAFGIKTSITPIERLTPDQAGTLRDALGQFDADTMAYRAGEKVIRNAMRELDRIACTPTVNAPSS